MNSLEDIDLGEAFKMYAISNTPIFLMKRLRADSATNEISRRFSGEQILAALQRSIEIAVTDSSDYVRPYVYLVALSKLSDISYLRAAADLQGIEMWDWFRYIQQVLMETYSPLVTTTIQTPRISGFSTGTQFLGSLL